jgi:hypothetical protein
LLDQEEESTQLVIEEFERTGSANSKLLKKWF